MVDLASHLVQANDSVRYFAGISPEAVHSRVASLALAAASPEKFTGESGGFLFVFSDKKLSEDAAVIKKVDEAKYYLKGFMSLVTAKLFSDNKDNVQAAFKIPPSRVKEVATHLPLMTSFESSQLNNKKHTTTTEFSTKFVEAALNLSIGNDLVAVKGVTDWLHTMGNQIKISAKVTSTNYVITVFSGIIEVLAVGGVIDVEPQLCVSGATLSITEIKASVAGCVKTQSFTLNYEGVKFRASLNMDAMQDSKVKEAVDSLVTDGTVKTIEDSKNYFGVS